MTEQEIKIRQQVTRSFQEIKTVADLTKLMNEVWSFLCKGTHKRIPLKDVTYFSNYKLAKDAYYKFLIPKKNGKTREIQAPVKDLKRLQICLNFILSSLYHPHPAAKGFILGQNISDAAKPHVRMPYVFHLDLKDFFTSISLYRVKACLSLPPFNLNGDKERIAYCIANICCTNDGSRTFLPQGAPTSPILSNIVSLRLDRKLTGLAKRFSARYTRYADDITFSSYQDIANNTEFQQELVRIISGQNFQIQPSKTRAEGRGYRQTVCGLTINEKVNVSKSYVKEIRLYLYLWERYGYERAQMYLASDIKKTKGNHSDIPQLSHYLNGKIQYMQMIKGNSDATYKTLRNKFIYLYIPQWKEWKKNILDFCDAVQNSKLSIEELNKWYKTISTNINIHLLKDTPLYTSLTKALSCLTLKASDIPTQTVFKEPIHNATLLPSFLYENFSKNDPLKFITHIWDGNADNCKFEGYEDFIRKEQIAFKEITGRFKTIDKNLFYCFYGFLHNPLNNRGWGQYKIKSGWSSSWLKAWCSEHPERSPFDCPIPENKREIANNVKLNYFSDIVELFKSEFQLRPETRQLKKLLRELVRQYLNFDFHVTFELTDVKLYTNVYMIRNILSDILHDMAQRKQFPDILVRVEDLGSDYVDILLCQKDSDYYATHLQLIQETESGDFCELKRKMANLCDWYVETQCKDGAFRINYLNSIQPDRTIAEPLLSDGVKGFTHRIRIYKHYAYENPNYP